MTRRKLINPTKLRTGGEWSEAPQVVVDNEALDLAIRPFPQSSPPEQEKPIDCSWKRPRLDDEATSFVERKPVITLRNGCTSAQPKIKKEPQLVLPRPVQTPTITTTTTIANNNNNNALANLAALPTIWLNSVLAQQAAGQRLSPTGFPNHISMELANFDSNLQVMLNSLRDPQQVDRYLTMLPKPPTSDLVKAENMLMLSYSAVTVKAFELIQLISTYEDLLRNAEQNIANAVTFAANGTHPLQQVNGSASGLAASLPPLQTSPSAGSISPLNSPHFPPGTANTPAQRPLAPAQRRLSSEVDMVLNTLPLTPGLGAKRGSPPSGRKRNDRRADSEMNEPNLEFVPASFVDSESVEQVQLSTKYPSVTICREKFNDIIRKGESSATRVIRMIMKHFFEPEVLAVSSLSGTGQYKEVLDPTVVNAIKDFISNRYPKLRSSRLNLCMTDVCVQARRVKTNQTRRSGALNGLDHLDPEAVSMAPPPDGVSALDSNSSNDGHPNEHYDLDLNITAPSLPAALEDRPLSPPLEGEARLVIA